MIFVAGVVVVVIVLLTMPSLRHSLMSARSALGRAICRMGVRLRELNAEPMYQWDSEVKWDAFRIASLWFMFLLIVMLAHVVGIENFRRSIEDSLWTKPIWR